jgi:hypothetical protein
MEIEYKIFYKQVAQQELNPADATDATAEADTTYNFKHNYTKLLNDYNYNSAVILRSPNYYADAIPDNIINIISQHDVLVIIENCIVKLDNIPINVKLIYIAANTCEYEYIHPLNNLPLNLEHLLIDARYYIHSLDFLPDTLKTLLLNGDCDIPLNNLPSRLQYLLVSGRYNEPLYNLPLNLKTLVLSEYYQNPLINLPPGLKELYVGSDYYLPIENLPDGLEDLTISSQPHTIILSPNLKKFEFGFEFGFGAYYFVELVDSIEEIRISTGSIQLLDAILEHHYPENLKIIKIHPQFVYSDIDNHKSSYKLQDSDKNILDEIKKNNPTLEIQFV